MGRFFTNVHVRPSGPSRDPRAKLTAILEARAAADGLHAVAPTERFDRLVAIGPPGPSRWITIADEATESKAESTLENLARTLSSAIDGHAVSVLVHDSDVLDLRLFESGRRLDHFVNQPDYFSNGRMSSKARRALQGDARIWAALLDDGASVDALEKAFRSTPLFAEETLAEVARLLGFGDGYDLGATDHREDSVPGFELRYFARTVGDAPIVDRLRRSASASRSGALATLGKFLRSRTTESDSSNLPRPLKADDSAPPRMLRELHTPATLVAIVALRMPQAVAAQLAPEVFSQWTGAIGGTRKAAFSTTTYGTGRPERGRISFDDLATAEGRRSLGEIFAGSVGFYAQTRVNLKAPSPQDVVMGPTHGFAFHVSHLPRDVGSLSPHLAFWFDVRGKRPDEIDRVRATLIEIVDDLVRAGQAHQAFLARWDWRPALTLDATPYELACGVHGQCTTRHTWAARFLRAVAETTWLGPSFVERSGGFQTPDGTALERLNGSWRISCPETRAASALERALAVFLPSHEDWKNEVLRKT